MRVCFFAKYADSSKPACLGTATQRRERRERSLQRIAIYANWSEAERRHRLLGSVRIWLLFPIDTNPTAGSLLSAVAGPVAVGSIVTVVVSDLSAWSIAVDSLLWEQAIELCGCPKSWTLSTWRAFPKTRPLVPPRMRWTIKQLSPFRTLCLRHQHYLPAAISLGRTLDEDNPINR